MAKATRGGRPKLPPLEDQYEFPGDASVRANMPLLQSAVYPVREKATGAERALRLWRKAGGPIEDLKELWGHEKRLVERLTATREAREVVVGVFGFVEDDDEFGLALEDAGYSLTRFLDRATAQHWLRRLGADRPRSILWSNFRRMATAVGMLHDQGIVHGRISADVIMTRGAEEADFKLSGFEWSLWISGPENSHALVGPVGAASRPERYSFVEDWRALGAVFANLLGYTMSLAGRAGPVGGQRTALDLTGPEQTLLKRLASAGRTEALDLASVLACADAVAREAARSSGSRAGTYLLLVPEHADLAGAVARATGGAIPLAEPDRQMEWAATDLAAGATLQVPQGFSGGGTATLLTAAMAYTIVAFNEDGGERSWDIALCREVVLRDEWMAPGGRRVDSIVARPIHVVNRRWLAVEERFRLGAAALDWSAHWGEPEPARFDRTALVRRALTLVQTVEAVTMAFGALPVQAMEVVRSGGRWRATIRAKPDNDRDEVARQIGMGDTAETLRRLFEEDERERDSAWFLGTTGGIGNAKESFEAIFIDVVEANGLKGYRFEIDAELRDMGRLFLRAAQDVGTEVQIRRRLRNIAAIESVPALADMLQDPWPMRQASAERPARDAAFDALDRPKQHALDGIWANPPTYFVVGPPGVGKTRLATEVVRRSLASDPSARLLITAQGHDALDNLQRSVERALAKAGLEDAILIRSSADKRDAGAGDAVKQAASLLKQTAESALASRAPAPVQKRLSDLAEQAARMEEGKDVEPGVRGAVWAAVDLLLDAASVVVSTSNSPDIGRLVEARANFDAVIVEEAAKATGPDLVGALSLSARRLLIGDHYQLPPFDSDRLLSILDRASLVERVVRDLAPSFVENLFADGELADLQKAMEEPDQWERIRSKAYALVQPFKSFVEDDERRAAGRAAYSGLSATLTEQHRMHPVIAKVVSDAFYRRRLVTADDRTKEVETEEPPFVTLAPLPSSPIVIVDFDHVSSTGSKKPMEGTPRWHNPSEVEAAMDVLRLIRPRDGAAERPTLAVLSPYGEQVSRIAARCDAQEGKGRLAHLSGFDAVRPKAGFFGTTDSFQGAEADIVIVSLVRNSMKTGTAALGFLRDARRMNVLLSRAKWQLVILTSRHFLRAAVQGVNPGGGDHPLRFIETVLDTVESVSAGKTAHGIPAVSVLRPEQLRGGT